MSSARAKLAAATQRLNAFTDELERIADWRDDLQARIWRAQICFEYCGLDPDEQDALAAEVQNFVAVCFALALRLKGNGDERERRAA